MRLAAIAAMTVALAMTAGPAASVAQVAGKETFSVGSKAFLLNGKPFVVKAAELHYPRIPRPYWRHRIKMCKALGMNTICLYVFWNAHEQREGQFDFSGNLDVAEFCRIAKSEGMYVIIRPGPYVCAEWEMGGLPWWLLKKKDVRLRERDPYFMSRVGAFEREVGRRLSGLTIQNGGPIIMVQVENEYGSYGQDRDYVSAIRDTIRRVGFDGVELFQCDWSSNFTLNGLEDLTWTMNFGAGADIDAEFRPLALLRPDAPLMCSEFWSGWFDKWGARHETRPAAGMTDGIDQMLSRGISFSLYMTHGGTSFGHWAGANTPGYQPDVTSYDYDAPINEQGLPTPKFFALREVMAKHNGGRPLPPVPKPPLPTIEAGNVSFTTFAPLGAGVTDTLRSSAPLTFEEADMGWGVMVYSTALPPIAAPSTLTAQVHDYARVFIDDRLVAVIDRSQGQDSARLPSVPQGGRLSLVVEGMGRVNFGRAIKDHKGLTGAATVSYNLDGCRVTVEPREWLCATIPDDYANARRAVESGMPINGQTKGAGYYRGTLTVRRVGDTFLDLEAFGKGQAYVNGHPLGRFWNIGPQQTLYVPGCWLHEGENEIVVQDIIGPAEAAMATCGRRHELDKLNLTPVTKGQAPDFAGLTPALEATFAPGNGWQTVALPTPAAGRHIALVCAAAHDGGDEVSVAEMWLRDESGERIARDDWRVEYVSGHVGNHTADKAIDLQESTYWQTSGRSPHMTVINMQAERSITAIDYLPRMEAGAPGSVSDFKIYVW